MSDTEHRKFADDAAETGERSFAEFSSEGLTKNVIAMIEAKEYPPGLLHALLRAAFTRGWHAGQAHSIGYLLSKTMDARGDPEKPAGGDEKGGRA